MTKERRIAVFLVIVSILVFSAAMQNYSYGATPTLASTNAAITNAFKAVSSAAESGGNVTGLVAELNTALNFTAQAVNMSSTNPTRAAALLQNATNIATQVAAQAASIQAAGASARQALTEESIAGAAVVVVIAGLLLVFGDRIYRMLWFLLYRNYIVKSAGDGTNG
jgi:hypothetical protein